MQEWSNLFEGVNPHAAAMIGKEGNVVITPFPDSLTLEVLPPRVAEIQLLGHVYRGEHVPDEVINSVCDVLEPTGQYQLQMMMHAYARNQLPQTPRPSEVVRSILSYYALGGDSANFTQVDHRYEVLDQVTEAFLTQDS